MLGTASEIKWIVFDNYEYYETWAEEFPNHKVLEIKYSMIPQSESYQMSYGVLIIYKEGESK